MGLSALDHPMLAALLGDGEFNAIYGFEAEWRAIVTQFRAAVGATYADHVHKAVSSQDVVDTCMMLALVGAATRVCLSLCADVEFLP